MTHQHYAYGDHMTEAQRDVVDIFYATVESEIDLCLHNARRANDAVVQLPHKNEKGLPVIHGSNVVMTSLRGYWLDRARQARSKLRCDECRNQMIRLERKNGMRFNGTPILLPGEDEE